MILTLKNVFRDIIKLLKLNFSRLLTIHIIYILFPSFSIFLSIGGWVNPDSQALSILTFIYMILFTPIYYFAGFKSLENSINGIDTKFKDLIKEGRGKTRNFWIYSLLLSTVFIISFIILQQLVLALFIFLLWLMISLSVTQPIIMLEELNAIEAIKKSFLLTRKKRIKLFLIYLSTFGLFYLIISSIFINFIPEDLATENLENLTDYLDAYGLKIQFAANIMTMFLYPFNITVLFSVYRRINRQDESINSIRE